MRLQPRSTLFPYTTLFRSAFGPTEGIPVGVERAVCATSGATSCRPVNDVARKQRRDHLYRESVLLRKQDRKSTRLNSSHRCISYAVFCLKKNNTTTPEVCG